MESEVQKFYGNRLRVRVCGICTDHEKLLLINHSGITKTNFWAPPGGGLNFGESAEECLKREFREEAGIEIAVEGFLFACELINPPLHAVELFFKVTPLSGQPTTGTDPEAGSPRIISDVKYLTSVEILAIPANELHGIFKYAGHPDKISSLRGYFKL